MWSNIARSGSTFSANPCRVRIAATFTPIAAIFSLPTQTPENPSSRWASMPKPAEHVDQRGFEPPDVRDHIGAPSRHGRSVTIG